MFNRKAEAAAAAHSAEMAAVLGAISRSQAVIEFTLDGTVIKANDNFTKFTGYGLDEIVGRHHSMFLDPAERDSPQYPLFWKRLNAGEFVAAKFRRLVKGGREVFIQASYNPVINADGSVVKVIKIATDITAEEQAAHAAEKARRQAEAQRQLVVSVLGSALERLRAGDLTGRVDEAFPAEYEKLRTDFNATAAELQETLAQVSAAVGVMRSGSDEISRAADDLSRRTEQQAATLEETAAALEEITVTVRRTAEGAGQAREVVSQAKADAQQSSGIVHDAVTAMGGIEQSSRAIGQIIGVIDEIAFQTNLLALNAGVEAARAGDAGRGFAVVASEVRALAQRSAGAAKEIKGLISESEAQVSKGVALVGATGEALNRIAGQVAAINGVVSDIAASAHEQATGLHQVNTAVGQMDHVTQQNAAMVEQSTAASHGLTQESLELARLIARFRLVESSARPRNLKAVA